MKLGKYYKNALPKVAGIIGLVAGIIGLVSTVLGLVGLFATVLTGIAGIMGLVMWILAGVFLILLGVAFIVLRVEIGYSGLSLGTGIMSIIAGAMTCSILLSFVGIAVLIPTAICAAYLFLKAKGIPEVEVKEVKKLVVRPVEVKAKKRMKPEEIEAEVYKYVKRSPGGIDIAECAEELGISEEEVEKTVNALVRKGKLEIG
jgi:membrane-bound ClpP family serine protease